jgi:hypothetical protein
MPLMVMGSLITHGVHVPTQDEEREGSATLLGVQLMHGVHVPTQQSIQDAATRDCSRTLWALPGETTGRKKLIWTAKEQRRCWRELQRIHSPTRVLCLLTSYKYIASHSSVHPVQSVKIEIAH